MIAVGDEDEEVPGYVRSRRFSGLRFRLLGGVPKSVVGRLAGVALLVGMLGGFTAVLWEARSLLMHDPRLTIASSKSIEITGNSHLSRPQLLSVFGGDVDRNILSVGLNERRHELESLPWVEHATVMRLLPNKVRVAITERTPVAFVRQGSSIGLVDAKGVLLDLSPEVQVEGKPAEPKYSFPVVTGVSASDPESTRAARMALYTRFMSDLGAVSSKLSEVDLSSPEDVKALISTGSSDVLVHFGDDDFLKRYQNFDANLPGWKQTYPKLASVDMRYEHNVVLEMAPGAAIPVDESGIKAAPVEAATKPAGKPARDKAKARTARDEKPKVKAKVAPKKPVPAAPAGKHLTTAFDVHAKKAGAR